MKIKQILSYLLVIFMATASVDAAAQRRTGGKSKSRTSLVKASTGLPNALGRDTYSTIKKNVVLKYVGNDPDEYINYTSYDIDIKWPTDIRLAGTGGSGATAEMDNHKSRVEEIQALIVNTLLDEYGTSDIKQEINKLTTPSNNWKVVPSVPESALDIENGHMPAIREISVKPYLSCNKWICFELTNFNMQGNGCDGYTKWVTIPRNQAAWNRTEITLISALNPSNYTDNVASQYGKEISALIKAAAQKDGSYEWIRNGNGISIPNTIRPEKTGLSFIFYQARCSYIDVFVSYAKLKPYLDSSVYNILAGGTGWSTK